MSDDTDQYGSLLLAHKGYKVYAKPCSTTFFVSLGDKVLEDSFAYSDLIMLLNDVTSTDIVIIQLGNMGGSCHTGVRLIHAIQECEGFVQVKVTGNCYSMGAMIALSGNYLSMAPMTALMFHNYSGGEYGKAAEMRLAVSEFDDHFNKFFEHVCAPFLTPKEINNIKNDRDVYVHAWDKDLAERIERHFPDLPVTVDSEEKD